MPLDGAEVRSCWVGRPLVLEDEPGMGAAVTVPIAPLPAGERYVSGFVLLDPAPAPAASRPRTAAEPEPPAPTIVERRDPTTDGLLWAELEG